jgi:pimeloyl-ACP methyl ester carboxylesterase
VVTGCVLLAPAFRFLQRRWEMLTEAEREEWRTNGVLRVQNDWVDVEIGYGLVEERDRFPLEQLTEKWATPLLIFHGLADQVVPVSDSLAFLERANFPDMQLRLFKEADHRLIAVKDEIADEACRFLEHAKASWETCPTSGD